MITEVRLLYAPFKRFVSGHVCVVFKLADGKEIVISPEARTDNFIPLLGFLPFYNLRYSKLEYNEYITKYQRAERIFHSKALDLEPRTALSLYEEMSERASYLEQNKERYHILSNSCITNTITHFKENLELKFTLTQIARALFKPFLLAQIIEMHVSSKISSIK
jgi:hypothetical protein